jgi:membrane protease YdiL (CAAX protease family)
MELSNTRSRSTAPSNRLVLTMRHHPLGCYFLLAFSFTWGWQLPEFALAHQQLGGPWLLVGILGPALAGFVMAGITEGRVGMVRLLRRVVLWRVAMRWYLAVFLILPAVWFVSVFLSPGGIAAFRVPSPSLLIAWLSGFAFAFVASLFVEESGWRGFALPRLQGRYGPLLGTLLLGLLWALWHLPGWAFFPSLTGAGTSFLSFTFAITYLGFVGYIVASAILITWVFNHSRGSILLAILFHASANATGGSFLTLFPSLFPHPVIPAAFEIGVIVVAVVVVVATRGLLGYDHYQRETALPAPVTDQVQEQGEVRTSV